MASSEYEVEQSEEIETLQAIYTREFQLVQTTSAWSKAPQRSFRINLAVSPEVTDKNKTNVVAKVSVAVTFTATYPKTIPILAIKDCENVQPKTVGKLEHVLAVRPKELLGNQMIYALVDEVECIVKEAVTAQVQGSSLEEERAARAKESAARAKEAQEEATRKGEEEKAERDRNLQKVVQEEVERKEALRRRRSSIRESTAGHTPLTKPDVVFDQDIVTSQRDGLDSSFRQISFGKKIGKGSITEALEAIPIRDKKLTEHAYAVKRVQVPSHKPKQAVVQIEYLLERLKSLRHSNIINVYNFKVTSTLYGWQIDILTDFGARGPLLEWCGVLQPSKARSLSIELLQALEFYHKNGIVHGKIHARNVLLCQTPAGVITARLADAGSQEALHRLLSEDLEPPRSDEHDLPWIPPEITTSGASKTMKTDIWCLAIVLVHLFFGVDSCARYPSADTFLSTADLSPPFMDMMRDMFRPEPRRRPNAFDVILYEFFRTDVNPTRPKTTESSRGNRLRRHSSRHQNSGPEVFARPSGRYSLDWDETARLGKGGYGEVVKARNKNDGRVYAIKKITQKTPQQLSNVLPEVYLLATLNHPYVVRYFTAWLEDDTPVDSSSSASSSTATVSSGELMNANNLQASFSFDNSTRGLDFISSSGYPNVEFAEDSEEDDATTDDSDNEEADNEGQPEPRNDRPSGEREMLRPPTTQTRPVIKSTLYIQMEFCDHLTLRDVIRKGLYEDLDDCWVLFRQVLEGLVHIHSHRIIHRDLKPENIFLDNVRNPKIGDFGLATTGVYELKSDSSSLEEHTHQEMTKNVGTALYVAPELRSNVSGTYSDKVDMYSLGIIFFEMCWPLKTAMERGQVLTALRSESQQLPTEFRSSRLQMQCSIVELLVKHRPEERPSSAELLHSSMLPVRVEDEWIQAAVAAFRDQESPHHNQIVSALFSEKENSEIDHLTWHAFSQGGNSLSDVNYSLTKRLTQEKLTSVFRRHGAKDNSDHRMEVFPLFCNYYTPESVVHYLDKSGVMVQLRYDLTLPYAILLAHAAQKLDSGKFAKETFAFGNVFRGAIYGGAPRTIAEADFDILSVSNLDLPRKEAEVIKVIDEIIDEFPALEKTPMCFHLSHSRLLDIIFEFCRLPASQWSATKEVLAKLNIDRCTWQKSRQQLRSPPIGISSTSLDDLAQFDFRDNADNACEKLSRIFSGHELQGKLDPIFQDIRNLLKYLKLSGMKRKLYLSPLSNFNSKFYQDCVMFQCVFDTRRRHVLAAGGRYDHLIQSQSLKETGKDRKPAPKAVGMTIAWERLVNSMVDYQKDAESSSLQKTEEPQRLASWTPRLCDVLVASFDSELLRTIGWKIVNSLWAHNISAQLTEESESPDELMGRRGDEKHSWIIHIRHETSASEKPDLKVRNVDKNEDAELRSSELISYLRGEIREREQREAEKARVSRVSSSHTDTLLGEKTNKVHVLKAGYKGKKSNKYRIIEAARARARELVTSYSHGPIASVDTRDEYLEQIQKVKLSDSEAWKKIIQDVPISDRHFLQELQEVLVKFKIQHGASAKKCFIYNFRTGFCMLYDLHL
ncbi:MAG: hypothetical protein M1831_002887 [Alyxoria varia]|nr:MAG: hypothetical protein M1831_002887 [Alyxoria varia]